MGKNLKRTLSLFLAAIMILGTVAVGRDGFKDLFDFSSISASAVSISDLTYDVNIEDGTVTITGCNTSASGKLTVPGEFDGNTVISIGASAFENCTEITKIEIPDSVETIGSAAFSGCTALTSVVLPENLEQIENALFENCSNLVSIGIPEGIVYIGTSAFNGCASLQTVNYMSSQANFDNIVVSDGNSPFENAAVNYNCCCSNPDVRRYYDEGVYKTYCVNCGNNVEKINSKGQSKKITIEKTHSHNYYPEADNGSNPWFSYIRITGLNDNKARINVICRDTNAVRYINTTSYGIFYCKDSIYTEYALGKNVLKQDGYEALKQYSKSHGGHHVLKTGNTDNGKISLFINGDSVEEGDTTLLDPDTTYYYILYFRYKTSSGESRTALSRVNWFRTNKSHTGKYSKTNGPFTGTDGAYKVGDFASVQTMNITSSSATIRGEIGKNYFENKCRKDVAETGFYLSENEADVTNKVSSAKYHKNLKGAVVKPTCYQDKINELVEIWFSLGNGDGSNIPDWEYLQFPFTGNQKADYYGKLKCGTKYYWRIYYKTDSTDGNKYYYSNVNWFITDDHIPNVNWDTKTEIAPTCTQPGRRFRLCVACGEVVEEQEIPALGHDYGKWFDTGDGINHKRICARDNSHFETAEHDWNGGEVTQPPTPTVEGIKTFTCLADHCGATRTEPIPITPVTVRFQNESGTDISGYTQTGYAGSEMNVPPNPQKTGYSFAGWYDQKGNVAPKENGNYIFPNYDADYSPRFTVNQYTITFRYGEVNNNAVYKTIKQNYNTSITPPADPAFAGYSFNGWDSQIPSRMPAQNITITAQWNPVNYPAKFYIQYSDEYRTLYTTIDNVPFNSVISMPAKPNADDCYSYGDWLPGDGHKMDKIGGKEYYSVATPKEYTATFKNKDGGVISTASVGYGSGVPFPEVPDVTGYTFTGWRRQSDNMLLTGLDSDDETMPAHDETYQAVYERALFDIHFIVDDVEVESLKMSLHAGDSIELPEYIPPEGYGIAPWQNENGGEIPATMPAEDLTLTALTYPLKYHIIYYIDDILYKDREVDYNSLVPKLVVEERPGYVFSGWDKLEPARMPHEDLELHGYFIAKTDIKYTVEIYKMNVAGIYNKTTFEHQGTADTMAYADQDYTYPLEGFTRNEQTSVLSGIIAGDGSLVLKVYLDRNRHSIKFKDGDTVIKASNPYYGAQLVKPADPVKEGYTFIGWSEDGTTIVDVPETVPDRDIEYKAVWQANQYTITFRYGEVNSNAVYKTVTQAFGTAVTAPANPACTGYTYIGWDSQIPETMPAQNLTVTALWLIKEYKVTYKLDGVEYFATPYESAFDTVTYGTAVPVREKAVKEGYTVSDWIFTPELIDGKMPAQDVVANATSTINTYTVTWIYAGGQKIDNYQFGAEITAFTPPAKEGYTFIGWDDTVPATMPARNLVFNALYSVNNYTITYILDGEPYDSKTYAYGAAVKKLTDPEQQGYIFPGWSPAEPETMPARDLTLSAEFIPDSATRYTVETYTMNVSGEYDKSTVVYTGTTGTTVNATYTIPDEGFTLNGQTSILSGSVAADGSLVLKVYFDRNRHTVSFDGASSEYYYESAISIPADPTKEGHTFIGWSEDGETVATIPATMPDGDIEYTSVWSVNSYTITYKLDGADYFAAPYESAIDTVDYGTTVDVRPNAVKTGYTVSGWVFTPELAEGKMPAENVVANATSTVNRYTVTYYVDGEEYGMETYDFNADVEKIEEPVKQGYVFSGWNPAEPDKMPAENLVIEGTFTAADNTRYSVETYVMNTNGEYEKTTENKEGTTDTEVSAEYTVPDEGFILNEDESVLSGTVAADGSLVLKVYIDRNIHTISFFDGEIKTHEDMYYGTLIVKPETPVKEGCSFIGWSENGEDVIEVEKTVPDRDIDYIAVWQINQYSIVFRYGELNDNVVYKTITQDYDTDITPPASPEYSGYNFTGWDGEIPEKMPAQNLTLTAQWEKKSYTITYTLDDTEYDVVTVVYDELVPEMGKAEKEGYSCSDWVFTPELVDGKMPASNVVATATSTKNKYMITWIYDNNVAVRNYYFGDEITVFTQPRKAGYTWSEWTPEVESTMPAYNLEYHSTSSPVGCTLTVNYEMSDGHSELAPESHTEQVPYDSTYSVDSPAVTGYTPSVESVTGKMNSTDGITVTVTYTPNEYNLTVNYSMSDGKDELAPETYNGVVEFGKQYSVASPTVEGYTPDKAIVSGTMGAGDAEEEVTYSPNAHTVTWNVDGEKTVIDVAYGDEIDKPADPEKDGYDFIGWSEDGEAVIDVEETVPDRDVEYIAVWSVKSYTITYKLDGEEYFEAPYESASDTYLYGELVTVREKAVKEGYTVSGWTFTPALKDGKMPAGNVVASATSTVNSYTVTWIVNGSSTVDTYNYGAEIIRPEDPSIPGKIFKGWSGEIPATMPAHDLIFVASFDVITHKAIFVVPDENGSYTDETGTYEVVKTVIFEEGQTAIAEPPVPEREGFTGEWEDDYTVGTADIVIRAIYTIIPPKPIVVNKTADENGDGTVAITLDAYSEAPSIFVEGKNEPLDIVLVVDQSGSMGEYMDGREGAPVGQRRRDYLVNTATSFVDSVKQNAEETGADHRISIVGFAMGSQSVSGHSAYQNTEVLTTVNNIPVTYNRATNEVYKNSLMSVIDDYDHITAAINNIDADGATAADLGFDMASGVFAQNNSDRKKVIIFLTDGEPTATNTFDSGVANKAITYSKRLKAQGITVYSIAISDMANPADTSSDFNRFLQATSSNYKYASSIWNLDDGSKDNGYFLSVRDENALQSIFDGIYVRSVAKTLNFGAVTLYDTVREEFTMTMQQEKAFRENTIRKYGITNSDITVDRRDDGTTYIEVRNLTPYIYYDSADNTKRWKVDVSFDVSENENALNACDYLTNTDEAGVIVGGYTVATFVSPTVTISEDRYIVEFLIGEETYEIREMNFGEEITAPECDYASWTIPEGATVDSGVVKYYADLGEKDRTVIWHIGEETITQNYATGEKITAPEVNEEGRSFTGWSPSVESYMGYVDLEYTAMFSEHVHNYKKTASSGLCTEGRKVTYTCSCGESYTETLPACEHKLETTVYETDTATITHIFCTECSYSEDKVLTFKTANTGSSGWWGYPGSTVASFNLYNDVSGGEIHDLDENQYLYIRVPVTSLNSASQQAISQGRTINVIHYLENGGTEKCSYAVDGDYIVVKCTSFSYYVFTTEEVDAVVTKAAFDCLYDGHQFGYVYNNDATTEADGTETEICSHCGATGETRTAEGTKLRPETVHTDLDSDGKCDDCGEDVIQGFAVSDTKVLRGKSLDWTVTTLDCVDTIRLTGTYTSENGTKKTLTYVYKVNQETANLNITDEEGVRTWNIRTAFTFSVDDVKIEETWSLSYKNDGIAKWNNFSETKAITVAREACYLNENTSEYEPYTLVSATGPENVQLNKFSEITVVTTSDCTKVRVSVNGKNSTYMSSSTNCTATENEDGTTTWVIRYKFTQAGENTYSVSTRGPAWSEAKTFTATVE